MVINVFIFNQNRETSDFQSTEKTKQDSPCEYCYCMLFYFIYYYFMYYYFIHYLIICDTVAFMCYHYHHYITYKSV